ncbi:hypothetical protein [Microseira sp. BLCC-F43]|uniref:hypothetical protein n=1 Tax=Microseira sp. BLCC-F43 TaxID=3153602 RepID=UPI0035B948E5
MYNRTVRSPLKTLEDRTRYARGTLRHMPEARCAIAYNTQVALRDMPPFRCA